jgi:hypothetical protein
VNTATGAKKLECVRLEGLSEDKHSSLLAIFLCHKYNKMLEGLSKETNGLAYFAILLCHKYNKVL